ncbi:MAG TPA: cellulase family glycosylhydrolase [Ktedonobacteraceae bacterium]|nr:cellulase family glycosylhydrolase [Ktedonobacteraceae bacterium]
MRQMRLMPCSLRRLHSLFVVMIVCCLACVACSNGPVSTQPSATPAPGQLPGQQIWKDGVSSYLFGTNDSVDYSDDNFVTDPHHIIQSSLKNAHFQIMREFIFHYSPIDGHRTTLGTKPQIQLDPDNPHEYDRPAPQRTTVTPTAPYGYELETRIEAIEKSGMQCLIVLPSIWTDPSHPVDPFTIDHIYTDPATGKVETDLDFAEKVVAYLGNRCNLYEIGNEPDLDAYPASGPVVPHMSVQTYLNRWVEFVTALRKINPRAKFIGPATASYQGNDCTYTISGTSCYMRNFLKGAKAAGVLPDAVSFHWYPCSNATDGFDGNGNCGPAQAQSAATVTRTVREWINSDLGRNVPLLITEWNADPGANPLMENASFMTQFTEQAMKAMISAGLDGAFQFDAQDDGEYGRLDMFDITRNDQPKAQYYAIKNLISQYRT